MKTNEKFLYRHLNGDPHSKQVLPIIVVYIFNENGELLLMKRNKHPYLNWWESVGGHIEFGEGVKDAAKREIREETGISVDDLDFVTVFDHIESDSYHRVIISFVTKVSNDVEVKPKEEHEEFKWFKINELPENIIPGPFQEAYDKLFKGG